jgi:hypothetical protein
MRTFYRWAGLTLTILAALLFSVGVAAAAAPGAANPILRGPVAQATGTETVLLTGTVPPAATMTGVVTGTATVGTTATETAVATSPAIATSTAVVPTAGTPEATGTAAATSTTEATAVTPPTAIATATVSAPGVPVTGAEGLPPTGTPADPSLWWLLIGAALVSLIGGLALLRRANGRA